MSTTRIAAAPRHAGRQRGIDALAVELREALRAPRLRQEPLVEQAMGAQALRLLATLDTECDSVDELATRTADAFTQHPDYAIITSFPALPTPPAPESRPRPVMIARRSIVITTQS